MAVKSGDTRKEVEPIGTIRKKDVLDSSNIHIYNGAYDEGMRHIKNKIRDPFDAFYKRIRPLITHQTDLDRLDKIRNILDE